VSGQLILESASIFKPAQKRLICVQANVMLNDLASHADSALGTLPRAQPSAAARPL
jgi:hypothetical protein